MIFPQNISTVISTDSGNLLAGMKNCIAEIDISKKVYTSFASIEAKQKIPDVMMVSVIPMGLFGLEPWTRKQENLREGFTLLRITRRLLVF